MLNPKERGPRSFKQRRSGKTLLAMGVLETKNTKISEWKAHLKPEKYLKRKR